MQDTRKEIFFPLFALFVIFSDELFFSFFYITQIPLFSGMKGRYAIGMASVAFLMMFCDLFKRRFSQRNLWQLASLFLILSLYLFTGMLYPHGWGYDNYIKYLLAYGGLSVPAAYVGMRLARGGYEDRMLRFLPYFLFAVSIVIGLATLTGFDEGRVLGRSLEDNGLNYQSSSYFMSFCFAYSAFYVFFLNDMKKNIWQKIVYFAVIPLVFLCAVGTIVGGGRGAFLSLIVAAGFITSRILWRSTGKLGIKYILMLIGACAVMVFLAIHYDVFDSAGAQRVALNLTHDENRLELRRLALASFSKSPLWGHGIGSIWWEVGFYSHNIIQDLLAETGILGTTMMFFFLTTMFFRLVRSSKVNNLDFFLLLIYLGHMVQNTFSGYWMSAMHLFLVFGYVYGKKKIPMGEWQFG